MPYRHMSTSAARTETLSESYPLLGYGAAQVILR